MVHDVDGTRFVDKAQGDLLVRGVLFVQHFDGDMLTV